MASASASAFPPGHNQRCSAVRHDITNGRRVRRDHGPPDRERVKHLVGNDPLRAVGRAEASQTDVGLAHHHRQLRVRHGSQERDRGHA